jgi:hypothetical protein
VERLSSINLQVSLFITEEACARTTHSHLFAEVWLTVFRCQGLFCTRSSSSCSSRCTSFSSRSTALFAEVWLTVFRCRHSKTVIALAWDCGAISAMIHYMSALRPTPPNTGDGGCQGVSRCRGGGGGHGRHGSCRRLR